MTGRIRAYNLFYFATLCIFISFLPVYFAVLGVPATHIGWLIGMGSFIGVISQPLWGVVSDRAKTVRTIILLTLGLSLVAGTLLFHTVSLPGLYLLVGLCYFFFLPTDPLTESLNVRWAQENGSSFGAIRMFGAIGYGGGSLLAGFVSLTYGVSSFAWLFLGLGAAALIACAALPDVTPAPRVVQWRHLRAFLRDPVALRFFLLVLIAAIPHRMNDSFLGVYMHSLGGTTRQIGLAWFLSAVSETALFALVPRLLRGGRELRLISLATLLYVLRYVAMARLADPRWVLLLPLTQGFTFVFFYAASIQYLYSLIPAEWRATGQTILAVLFFGISGIVGSVVGGWLFDLVGGQTLYLAMACMSGLGFLFSLRVRAS